MGKSPFVRIILLLLVNLTVPGQDPSSFIDRTPEAVMSLVQQASLKFSECYIGLSFDTLGFEKAALSGL